MYVTDASAQAQVWTVTDIFFGCVAASLPVLNALIPKKWRSGVPSVDSPSDMSKGGHRFVPHGLVPQQPPKIIPRGAGFV